MHKKLMSALLVSFSLLTACYDMNDRTFFGDRENGADEKSGELFGKRPVLAGEQKIPEPKTMTLPQQFTNALAASRNTWDTLKKESRDTYSYMLESGVPGWTPNRYQTIVEVEQGIVADYTLRPIEGSINDEMKKNAPTQKTLDELYDECEHAIIPNLKEDQWFMLDFFANGVLASCSFNTCGLMDSEGKGISLKALALRRTQNFAAQDSERNGRLSIDCKQK